MGRTLLCVLACALLVASIVDERSKALDAEYEKLMGEKVLDAENDSPVQESDGDLEEKHVGDPDNFNPHEDLHNEEYKKWASGEPYMLAKSKSSKSSNGYVCQQFTLPKDEGTSLKLLDVKDLNACKCACNEERGKNAEEGRVGCNAFAYLAGKNVKAEANITVNECHLKRHFMYKDDWQKVANPWIFCVQQGPGSTGGLSMSMESSVQVGSPSSIIPSLDLTTLSLMGCSALVSGIAVYFVSRRRKSMNYLLMVDDAEI
jgi:hypothetical protein